MSRWDRLTHSAEAEPLSLDPYFAAKPYVIVAVQFHDVVERFMNHVLENVNGQPRLINNIRYETPEGVTARRWTEKAENKKGTKLVDEVTIFGLAEYDEQIDRVQIVQKTMASRGSYESRQAVHFSRENQPIAEAIFTFSVLLKAAGVKPSPELMRSHGLRNDEPFESFAKAVPEKVIDMGRALGKLEAASQADCWTIGVSQEVEYKKQINGADPRLPKPGLLERYFKDLTPVR